MADGASREAEAGPRDEAVSGWPDKYELFGVQVSAVTYGQAVASIIEAARHGRSAVASCHAAHAIVCSSADQELRARVNSFEIVAPDGQPVRWTLASLHAVRLPDRVYGPELMLRLCGAASEQDVSIYLYGGAESVVERLKERLESRFPRLSIVGAESPPFRPLSKEEDEAVTRRINESGAGVVFIGLGCPKQDHFAYEHRGRIRAVQVCVGAAFDFHAGVKKMAPPWMQRNGLEWLFRSVQEPRRLGWRYLSTNSLFVLKFAQQWLRRASSRKVGERASATASGSTEAADPIGTAGGK